MLDNYLLILLKYRLEFASFISSKKLKKFGQFRKNINKYLEKLFILIQKSTCLICGFFNYELLNIKQKKSLQVV